MTAPVCRVCGLPLVRLPGSGMAPGAALPPVPAPRCGGCRTRRPAFAYARAAALYADVAREALHALKFRGKRSLARPLGDLLAEAAPGWAGVGRPDVLVPVPLHRDRERERGFNQAALIAARLGRWWAIPVADHALERPVATRPQTELSGEERRRNMRGAFAVRRPDRVRGRHVVLVDDVLTTGATAESAAALLRRAGAVRVGVLTVARAL